MNSGALKGFPDQVVPNEVLQANSNGNIVPTVVDTSFANQLKWGND